MQGLEAGEHDLVLDGITLHYTVRGSGPPLVLHSGGPGLDARTWGDCAGLDRDFALVILHPRGSGLSGDPADGSFTLADYAADLDALRCHLGLARIDLLGWSHGGMVAQVYAARYPESVDHLVLYSTSACFGAFLDNMEEKIQGYRDQPWFEDAYAALQDEWTGRYVTGEEMSALLVRELKFYFCRIDSRAAEYLDSIRPYPVRIDSLRAFNENEAPTMDLRPLLSRIRAPTLVLAGRHDFITNLAMAEEMQRHIASAELAVFDHSGHFAIVEEPDRFRERVCRFIGKQA
jgi:proline iminopeptidase